ncbi:hypothetical protein [Pseudonocardia spinosispora]|uniref:hypothetical protein n=1 Tax=Pseudonocardia spinosispora TaxID=103441 RepID=UPI0003FAF1D7|nr:hypothetical protein [Pseudonocardia spinosispora]
MVANDTASPQSPTRGDFAAPATLYLARILFALAWAASLAAAGPGLSTTIAVLVVLYPAVDAAAVITDAVLTSRREALTRAARSGLAFNVAVSVTAAIALGLAAASSLPAILRVWGIWATVAGLGQLVVALARRRSHQGQWPLIISGGLSCIVGFTFIAKAAASQPSLSSIPGYAVLGAVFFTVALLRLWWSRRTVATTA